MGQIPGEAEDTDMNKAYLCCQRILATISRQNKCGIISFLVSHWLRISLPGDMGLISGSVRYHEPQKNLACMPKEVSLCFLEPRNLNYSAQALQLQKPEHPGAHALEKRNHCNEKSAQSD